MLTPLLFILGGYLCGSVLFARLAADLFGKTAILSESKDANPGAANAFQYGGFWWGAVVLCEGADSIQVQCAVVEAVSTLCGIGADKVAVLKMGGGE